MAAVTFDVPFVLGMMRLHEEQEMHQASHLADSCASLMCASVEHSTR